jgi:hypothetical protein
LRLKEERSVELAKREYGEEETCLVKDELTKVPPAMGGEMVGTIPSV